MAEAGERFHPSEYIQDELDSRGWSLDELAIRMGGDFGVNRVALDFYMTIGAGEPGLRIGRDIAAQLGAAFGTSSELWLGLEKAWLAGAPTPRETGG